MFPPPVELEKYISNELKPVASVIDALRRSDCAPVLMSTTSGEIIDEEAITNNLICKTLRKFCSFLKDYIRLHLRALPLRGVDFFASLLPRISHT